MFGEYGNEEELAFLVGKIIRAKDELRLKRLLQMILIEELYVSNDSQTFGGARPTTKLFPIFKRSTQRDIRFSDSSFDQLDFKGITGVFLGFHRKEDMYNLGVYKNGLVSLDSLTNQNIVKQYYIMNFISLGMVNCDRFLRSDFAETEKIQMEINLGSLNKNTITVALAFPNLKCVMPAVIQKDGKMRTGPIPKGMTAKLVAYTYSDGKIIAEIRDFEVLEPMLTLNLDFVEEEEFLNSIKNL